MFSIPFVSFPFLSCHLHLSYRIYVMRDCNLFLCDIFSDKRKASSDQLVQQQPPQKKLATETTMQINRSGGMVVSGFSNTIGSSSLGRISRHLVPNENMSGGSAAANVLSQAWKDDLNAGQLLGSLTDLFSEGMFAFTPKSELCMFLWESLKLVVSSSHTIPVSIKL